MKKKLKPWKKLDEAQAEQALATSVHFYSKATDSNAAPAGVRLPADEPPVSIPYVAFSSTAFDRRLTTYTVGAPKVAPFNQCMSVIEGIEADVYEGVDQLQRLVALDAARVLNKHFSIETIDPRLRQVLLPDGEGSDVSLTPLHSDPLSFEIESRLDKEKASGFSWRRPVQIGIGGSKPQNVGRRTRSLGSLINFSSPRESQDIKVSMAVKFKGVQLKKLLPIGLIVDFANAFMALSDSSETQSAHWREYEIAIFRRIAAHVISAAEKSANAARSNLGDGVDIEGDEITKALIYPELRDSEWRHKFSVTLVRLIENFKVDRRGARLCADGRFAHLIQYVEQEALS